RRVQRSGQPTSAVSEGWLDSIRHDSEWTRAAGNAPFPHRLRTLPDQAAPADCRRHPPAHGGEFHGADELTARSFLNVSPGFEPFRREDKSQWPSSSSCASL